MRQVLWILTVSLALLVALPASLATAADRDPATATFEELKGRYLTLRNTDVRIARTREWERLAGEFVRFVNHHPTYRQNPFALLNAAVLYENLYRRVGQPEHLKKSTDLLTRLAQDYPEHALADDALLKRGDLVREELKDVTSARRNYETIVERYPTGDMLAVARARLALIDGKGERRKSTLERSIERPRILRVGARRHTKASNKRAKARPGRRAPLIVLDPGHGGEDFGAVGVGGLLEKDVALDVAIRLEKLLVSELGAVVRLTRRKDVFVPLAERTALANDFGADLLISIHANASPGHKQSGFESYYLDNTHDQASRKLAERENSSIRFEGEQGDLSFMLSDLIQNAKLEDSIMLANLIQRSLRQQVSKKWKGTKSLGVKRGPFYVLVGAHMPCVLVELAFIDSRVDGPRLARPEFRAALARSLMAGIKEFLARAPATN